MLARVRGRPPRPKAPAGQAYCGRCKKFKLEKLFYRLRTTATGRYPTCIRCYRRGRAPRIVQIRKTNRAWARRLREEAVGRYGGACDCCGEKAIEFLAVAPKRKAKMRVPSYWRLRKDGYPKGFRVLCANCKSALSLYGYCPHDKLIIVG